MKLAMYQASPARRICVFGPPKAGKTELVGKLAEKYNLLWLDLENGFKTLHKLPPEYQERIELVRIPDTKNFPIGIETCLKIFSGRAVSVCDEHGKVDCPACKKNKGSFVSIHLNELPDDWIVVIDSVTQLSNSVMNFLAKDQSDDYKPEWEDYRKQGALLDKIFSNIQQARYNCVAITHESMVEMEDKRQKIVPVCGTSNWSRNFGKYWDDVIYLEVVASKHKAASSTTYKPNVLAGSRSGIALEKLTEPSLLPLFESISERQDVVASPQITRVIGKAPAQTSVTVKPAIKVEAKAAGTEEVVDVKHPSENTGGNAGNSEVSAPSQDTPVPTEPPAKAVEQVAGEVGNVDEGEYVASKSTGEKVWVSKKNPDGSMKTSGQFALDKLKAKK